MKKITHLNRLLKGKTIKRITCNGVNMATLFFTDGSSVELWAETGSMGIANLFLEEGK